MSFKIGNLTIDPPVIQAPMSGVTSLTFRRLLFELNGPGTIGLWYSEFVSVEAITRLNKPTLRLLRFDPEQRPFAVQIFGRDVERMALAARLAVQQGADCIDINCGCPVSKIVKRGGGSDLMRAPETIARIVEAVKKSVAVPVTIKIRSGWDQQSINALFVARLAQQSGADMVTLHGRTRAQGFKEQADWALVAQLRQALTIPVVGSGDITTAQQIHERLRSGAAHGVMVARGMLARPWIFKEHACFGQEKTKRSAPVAGLAPIPFHSPSIPQVLRLYARLLAEDRYPDHAALGKLKQLAVRMIRESPGSAHARRTAMVSQTLSEFFNAIEMKY